MRVIMQENKWSQVKKYSTVIEMRKETKNRRDDEGTDEEETTGKIYV